MMKRQARSSLQHVLLISCALVFTLLLTACDLFGSSSNAQPTPTPTPKPAMTTYTGDGFSISYPQGWTAKTDNNQLASLNGKMVTFSDITGITQLSVGVIPNPGGVAPTSAASGVVLNFFKGQAKNYKEAQVPSTATVGGESWDQSGATGDVTTAGTTANAKLIVLADNHPAHANNTRLFVIAYGTATQLFDLQNSTAFQPMLQSFKFQS
ncbi:MAG TPA: hypothetical protein VFB12_13835 [Ktedonobacteraceae bacterium]|nr:hypothetical protein [Ktedonobacteraceae bacterium]